MKAEELRIGNFIGRRYGARLLENECDILDLKEILKKTSTVEFYPIPLTEEWLVKFGFEVVSDRQDMNRKWYKTFELKTPVLSISYYYDINFWCFDYEIGYGNNEVELKHVHQLQNLYHSLVGKELAIVTK